MWNESNLTFLALGTSKAVLLVNRITKHTGKMQMTCNIINERQLSPKVYCIYEEVTYPTAAPTMLPNCYNDIHRDTMSCGAISLIHTGA